MLTQVPHSWCRSVSNRIQVPPGDSPDTCRQGSPGRRLKVARGGRKGLGVGYVVTSSDELPVTGSSVRGLRTGANLTSCHHYHYNHHHHTWHWAPCRLPGGPAPAAPAPRCLPRTWSPGRGPTAWPSGRWRRRSRTSRQTGEQIWKQTLIWLWGECSQNLAVRREVSVQAQE